MGGGRHGGKHPAGDVGSDEEVLVFVEGISDEDRG